MKHHKYRKINKSRAGTGKAGIVRLSMVKRTTKGAHPAKGRCATPAA